VNIISKFVLLLGTIWVWFFLLFSTFMWEKNELIEDLALGEVELWTFELIKDETNNFTITDKTLDSNEYQNKIYVEQVSNISRFFTNNEISEVIVGPKWEENKINIEPQIYLNIEPGIYLFDLNEINKNFVVDWGRFSIENKGPGSFIVNNLNPSKTVIFSLDTIINLNIKDKDETLTSILLYPHSYLIFNQKRNLLVKNGDLLKISSIFTLDFFDEKIFSQNEGELLNTYFTDIITLKNDEHKSFIENTLWFLASELEEREENFSKYTTRNFITLPGEIYIQKYFSLFVNTEKQKTYYKNIILRNIITLFHEKKQDPAKIKFIKENISILEQIDLEEAKKMKKIVYFYYINNLKIKESSVITAMNFAHLIQTIENNKGEIEKWEALFSLKTIFKNYNYFQNSNILEEISSFKEKYIWSELEYEKESSQYKEIEYLLFFIEKILTTELKESEKYIDEISVLLKDYANISSRFYDSNTDSIKKTGLFKNSIVLGKLSEIIKETYFKPNRTTEGLLQRKDFISSEEWNNKVNRNSISRMESSINTLNDFYSENKQFLDSTHSNDAITINRYIMHISLFKEFFEALDDYERYKSKYDTEKSIFLGWESILWNQQEDNSLSLQKAYNYLKSFNGASMTRIEIEMKNYDSCNNPYNLNKSEDEESYCYEIKNLNINGNTLWFTLSPYEKNKISEITINSIPKNGSYKLDNIEEELNEKIKKVTRDEEKNKYDFKNFFLNTFITQNSWETKEIYETEENILKEDKVIKTFKRNKLLWSSWDFSILQGFLDIKYNDLIVKEDYSIFIKTSSFNLSIDTCNNQTCESNFKQYEWTLESQYEFTNSHTFKKILIKIIDPNNKDIKKYSLWWNTIEVIWNIKVDNLKNSISILLSHIDDLETSLQYLKNNLEINNIKIKYYADSKRTKIESNYKNKKLDIYIEYGGAINIYNDGRKIHSQTLQISELENTLNTIK